MTDVRELKIDIYVHARKGDLYILERKEGRRHEKKVFTAAVYNISVIACLVC